MNDLILHSFGNEGLEELKNKISDLDKVYIAFYREEHHDEDDDPGYIIINYIAPSTSSIKRGISQLILSIGTAVEPY